MPEGTNAADLHGFKNFDTLLTGFPGPSLSGEHVSICHVVNPFICTPGSDHDRAHRVTAATMAEARAAAAMLADDITIHHVAVVDTENPPPGLDAFDEVVPLQRTILDVRTFRVPRPLPMIADILDAPAAAGSEILVYTNIDIALSARFYQFVANLFRRGHDALVLSRRTISGRYEGRRDIPLMSCETGAPHPGYDCFAFRARLREQFIRTDTCLGISGMELPIVYNMMAFAEAPVVLNDAQATFHIGDYRIWQNTDFEDYAEHHREELDRLTAELCQDKDRRARLIQRLSEYELGWVLPNRVRLVAGLPSRRGKIGQILCKPSMKWFSRLFWDIP